MLVGRESESDALDRMLAGVRAGGSGVLVLRGEAGIGKTALLDRVAERAAGLRVARVAGVESEMDLGFAGLHQLLAPFLDGMQRLPAARRDALGAAFGLAGAAPDRFLVGLATLALLGEAAAGSGVLCVIDDAQWLDRVSCDTLGFVARRLRSDGLGMVFAVRDDEPRADPLDGLPELVVGALPDAAALELLAASAGHPVAPRVGARIVAETGGNPLALREFGAELTAAEASGAVPLTEPLRFSRRLQERYRSRVRALPRAARLFLVLAAADRTGEPGRIWRAAAKLGIDPEAEPVPATDRLLTWEPRIRFRHPLMRSAAYYAAPAAARRRAHEALAAVIDPRLDPDRRAWHLAAAASGPDEDVAAELARAADRARGRGAWAGAAAFLERAAALTPDPARRAERLLDAADVRWMAGDAVAVRALLRAATSEPADSGARARVRRLEGLTLFAAGKFAAATPVLFDAAARLGPHDARLAWDTTLDAVNAAYCAGPARARRLLRRLPAPDQPGLLPLATAAPLLYDDAARRELEDAGVPGLRARGALATLLGALLALAGIQVQEGRLADAEATVAEGRALSEAAGLRAYLGLFAVVDLEILAWRGEEAAARALGARLIRDLTAAGHGLGAHLARGALARLEAGLGNYAAVGPVAPDHDTVLALVEAQARGGRAALEALAPLAVAAGTPAALGRLALGRALAAADQAAEAHYRLAVGHLRAARHTPMLARAHQLYGEWLRRQRRRREAREQLDTACRLLADLGLAALAERARAELRATGARAPKRSVDTRDALTAQEARIARMAGEGATNAEIAARLFISPSTVEYHLRKVFRKLGVTSRVRLALALRDRPGSPPAAGGAVGR
ncbi:AAA family ATPase [Dactylosporangium sp. CA-092794]|uniref:helix-turn-helix transcriptional regulator n=1 Tax=Dactylosporangium sp. CA-092794 TaxID=3239929 RepID=UPI003D8F9484